MRAFLVLAALTMAAPALAADPAPLNKGAVTNCPRTFSYLADANGIYRGKGVAPQKLNQLPPAVTYMAVYRQIGAKSRLRSATIATRNGADA